MLATGEAAAEIQRLLLDSITNPQEGVRYCAVTWAVRLLPFTNVAARYICGVAAGDSKLEVKEAGVGGLKASTFSQSQGAGRESTRGHTGFTLGFRV